MLTEELKVEMPVKVKSTFLRKSGSSYTIRVPAFWVENEGIAIGSEIETHVSKGGVLVLRKKDGE